MNTLAAQRSAADPATSPLTLTLPLTSRLAVTGLVALTEAAHLAWEQTHGGIVSHHLLADPSMPAIWNGWGLLVLPAIAWIASARLVRPTAAGARLHAASVIRLLCALAAGLALSVAFAAGRSDVAGMLFPAIVLSGLAVRVYRSEYLLGFVLGMTYTFGGVLPALIGGIIALLSAAAWFGLWPLASYAAMRLRARVAKPAA